MSCSYDLMDQCYLCLRGNAKIMEPNQHSVSGEQNMATASSQQVTVAMA